MGKGKDNPSDLTEEDKAKIEEAVMDWLASERQKPKPKDK